MIIETIGSINTIILGENETLMLTTPEEKGETCIFIRGHNGRVSFEGGSEIVSKIEGQGWHEKIMPNICSLAKRGFYDALEDHFGKFLNEPIIGETYKGDNQ